MEILVQFFAGRLFNVCVLTKTGSGAPILISPVAVGGWLKHTMHRQATPVTNRVHHRYLWGGAFRCKKFKTEIGVAPTTCRYHRILAMLVFTAVGCSTAELFRQFPQRPVGKVI